MKLYADVKQAKPAEKYLSPEQAELVRPMLGQDFRPNENGLVGTEWAVRLEGKVLIFSLMIHEDTDQFPLEEQARFVEEKLGIKMIRVELDEEVVRLPTPSWLQERIEEEGIAYEHEALAYMHCAYKSEVLQDIKQLITELQKLVE